METKQKELYDAPSTMVFGVGQEGMICVSDVKGGNSINDWGNGGSIDDELFF